MKFHFIVAAAVALLCAAAPIATAAYDDADVVQPNVVEIEQEEGFLNQALNYLSEVEKTNEVLAETQSGKKSEGEDDNKKSSSSKDNNNKSKDKKEKSPEPPAPSKKDREPKEPSPTRKPKEEREKTPKPTREPKPPTPKPTKEEKTPKPTREPKPPTPKPTKEEKTPKPTHEPKPTPNPTRRTRRPTPRPTRRPTISRSSQRAIDKWIHREWREDECDVRRRLRRLMSYSCKHLEDIVCTQRRRWLSQEAIDVCEKVGLPVSYRSEYSEDLYSEDAEFDYELMYVEDEE